MKPLYVEIIDKSAVITERETSIKFDTTFIVEWLKIMDNYEYTESDYLSSYEEVNASDLLMYECFGYRKYQDSKCCFNYFPNEIKAIMLYGYFQNFNDFQTLEDRDLFHTRDNKEECLTYNQLLYLATLQGQIENLDSLRSQKEKEINALEEELERKRKELKSL